MMITLRQCLRRDRTRDQIVLQVGKGDILPMLIDWMMGRRISYMGLRHGLIGPASVLEGWFHDLLSSVFDK